MEQAFAVKRRLPLVGALAGAKLQLPDPSTGEVIGLSAFAEKTQPPWDERHVHEVIVAWRKLLFVAEVPQTSMF